MFCPSFAMWSFHYNTLESCANLLQVHLQKLLQDNLKLAQEYRELQRALTIARREAVCVFERRNRAEAYVHDHKQVTRFFLCDFFHMHVCTTAIFCMCE